MPCWWPPSPRYVRAGGIVMLLPSRASVCDGGLLLLVHGGLWRWRAFVQSVVYLLLTSCLLLLLLSHHHHHPAHARTTHFCLGCHILDFHLSRPSHSFGGRHCCMRSVIVLLAEVRISTPARLSRPPKGTSRFVVLSIGFVGKLCQLNGGVQTRQHQSDS